MMPLGLVVRATRVRKCAGGRQRSYLTPLALRIYPKFSEEPTLGLLVEYLGVGAISLDFG